LKKILLILIIGSIILSSLGVVGLNDDKNNDLEKSLSESIIISKPIVKDNGEYITVELYEATSTISEIGNPMLPVVTKIFTFPFKTKINSVEVSFSEQKTIQLTKQIGPAPEPVAVSVILKESKSVKNSKVYEESTIYPTDSHSIKTGSAIVNGEHVLILGVTCNFVRYSPMENILYYSDKADIKVLYEEPINPVVFEDEYDMVIIAPSEYSSGLQSLITHKNNYDVNTILKTTESIYSEYEAWDEAEEIKYFIKDAIENWGVTQVMLVGSVDKVPIRSTFSGWWEEDVLCDLYYQDIYDGEGEFCDWDGNENHVYGEVEYDHHNMIDLDDVDLFPDVNLGRLACMDNSQVNIVVDKIINYETNTYGKSWFNNIVLAGGDTFPTRNGNEGEDINDIVAGIMSDFTPTRLWTSTNTFNSWNLNKEINEGAGFVDYSGHGYTNRMGTHPPDKETWIIYHNINMLALNNGYKLPIIYFDACLTSKLDYDTSESSAYSRAKTSVPNSFLSDIILTPIIKIIKQLISKYLPKADPKLVPCFSWNWLIKENGGAIATIGSTRTAYGGIDSGAGKISIEFFNGYESSDSLGEMMTYSQYQYIMDVPHDMFTVEEFVLLGDPSLKVGGYP